MWISEDACNSPSVCVGLCLMDVLFWSVTVCVDVYDWPLGLWLFKTLRVCVCVARFDSRK